MEKYRVLFICVHNSARSQIAQAWVNQICGDLAEAQSAGLEPGVLHPLAVKVMKEVGIDISHHKTKGVLDVIREGTLFSYVITVCDESAAEACPIFPGVTTRLHWSFSDPAASIGTKEEKLIVFRAVRDSIKTAVQEWCHQIREKEAEQRRS
jgi:arsenate reductase (thioredoxin)